MDFLSDRRTEIQQQIGMTAEERDRFDAYLMGYLYRSVPEDARKKALKEATTHIKKQRKPQADRLQI